MAGRQWTQTEDETLRLMYIEDFAPTEEIGAVLNRSRAAVKQRVQTLGLVRRHINYSSPEQQEIIKSLYGDRGHSLEDISAATGLHPSTVKEIAHRQGFSHKARRRSYTTVSDYFDVIDSTDKAYWLGFIAADGTLIRGDKGLDVRLDEHDGDHLAKLRDSIAPDAELKPVYKNDGSVALRLTISDIQMGTALAARGLRPHKDKRDDWWPQDLDEIFQLAFVSGLFDGDGSLYASGGNWKFELSAPQGILVHAQSLLMSKIGDDISDPKPHSNCSTLYRLRTGSKTKVIALESLLVPPPLGMARKRFTAGRS